MNLNATSQAASWQCGPLYSMNLNENNANYPLLSSEK
jgi:hypothetical protein